MTAGHLRTEVQRRVLAEQDRADDRGKPRLLHGGAGQRGDRPRGGVRLLGGDAAVLDREVGRVAGGVDALEARDLAVGVDRYESTRRALGDARR